MRIISGNLKGKKIFFLKTSSTRPLKDSVKENIFNILTHSQLVRITLVKAKILDLYSGVGSFGLECISRKAEKVTFVEKDKNAADILKKNILNLKIVNKTEIYTDEVKNFLQDIKKIKYEIIFFDPPFAKHDYVDELKLIHEKKLYDKNHIVIIHREKNSSDNLNKIINQLIIKNYGRSKLIFGQFL